MLFVRVNKPVLNVVMVLQQRQRRRTTKDPSLKKTQIYNTEIKVLHNISLCFIEQQKIPLFYVEYQ